MTSELNPSQFNEEFIRECQKNYAYNIFDTVTGDRKTVVKVRGITPNYKASRLVNFLIITFMTLAGMGEPPTTVTVHTERKIRSKSKGGGLVTIITVHEDNLCRIYFNI